MKPLPSVFNHLLDDCPLPASEPSSSILVAAFSQISSQQGKSATVGGKLTSSCEVEKGLLMLISSDSPGLQVNFPSLIVYIVGIFHISVQF